MDKTTQTIKLMQWEITKGHIISILHTYWGDNQEDEYNKAKSTIKKFILDMDDLIT